MLFYTKLADDCITALNNRLFTVAFIPVLSKVFDKENKDIMIRKLKKGQTLTFLKTIAD